MSRRLRLVRLAIVLAVCLVIPACKSKVTKANFDKIKEGMTLADVEKILGKGEKEETSSGVATQFGVHIESAPTVGGGSTYTWDSGVKQIKVFFNKEGKVTSKTHSGL